jgi:hypothetical protein
VQTIEASGAKGKELIGPRVQTYEQARNIAMEIVDDIGKNTKQNICNLESSYAYGKSVGRISEDGAVQWYVDWDPKKGCHINIKDYRFGGGEKSLKYVVPFDGTEETFKALIDFLDR